MQLQMIHLLNVQCNVLQSLIYSINWTDATQLLRGTQK